ncbi:MAG: DJ-1/PfpI family protein [Ilumatobacteraceae bacterium]
MVTVGARPGVFAGPGGHQTVDATFLEIDHADVVVPGGLGCERAADDPDLRHFLHRMESTAPYIAASSTGSVVLASAGLLHGQPAATHWLASDLLRRYGSEADGRRLVIAGKVITCVGQISAVDAALTLVERIAGAESVDQIRATLLERGRPLLHEPTWAGRVMARLRDAIGAPETERTSDAERAPDSAPVTPLSVMIELVDNDDDALRLRRSAGRRRR